VACGTYAGEVVIADMESGDVLKRWTPEGEEQSEITAIDFDGEHVSSGDAGGSVYFRRGEECLLNVQHSGTVTGVHWTGLTTAYSCSADKRLVEWDLDRGCEKQALQGPRPLLCMSVCEKYAALGRDDGSVVVCSLSPLREMFAFKAHTSAVSSIHLVTVSQLLTGSSSGEVAIWRLDEDEESGRRCTRFEGHTAPVVALNGDAEKIVSGARDGTVRVWDIAKSRLRFMLQGFTAYIGSVEFSSSWLCADGTNNAVILMDFATDEEEDDDEEEEDDDDDEDDDGDDDDDDGEIDEDARQ